VKIFGRKSPAVELDGLNARKGLLAKQLTTVEEKLDEAIASRQTRLLEGDPADVTSEPPIIIERLRDEKSAVVDALATIDSKIMDAQASVDREQDRVRRETGSKELAIVVEGLTRVHDELAAVAAKVAPALSAVLNKLPAPHVVAPERVKAFLDGVLEAAQTVLHEGQAHSSRLVAGDAQVVRAIAEPVMPSAPIVERQQIFLLVNGKWTEPDGTVRTAGRHIECDPPAAIAELAIEYGHALEPLNEHAIALRQRTAACYAHFAESDCVDISRPKQLTKPVGTPTAAPPAIHSEFARGGGGFASVMRNPR
jgi:hypothetical protein